jgi:hypothetical protein|nr:MAG TPA: hypothetical protein [Caudoviricetes sp.]
MDLLFKRYASPFLLFDELIVNNQSFDFIQDLLNEVQEESYYRLWLYKGFDKDYEEFKEIIRPKEHKNTNIDVKGAIQCSIDVMNELKPQ